MLQSSSSLALGFHGCERAIGEKILSGQTHLGPSKNEYDWLGNGRYFWEGDSQRAEEFAIEKRLNEPFVIGAVIDLGYCLNLLNRENIALLKGAYDQLVAVCAARNGPLPKNKKGRKKSDDYKLRFLDCAVLETIHIMRSDSNRRSYDTVRFGKAQMSIQMPASARIATCKSVSEIPTASKVISGQFRKTPRLKGLKKLIEPHLHSVEVTWYTPAIRSVTLPFGIKIAYVLRPAASIALTPAIN